jgi:alpha/beta superfamily hydrolase
MNIYFRQTILLLTLALAGIGLASASDTAKEKRWADQIVDSIMTGDAEWLSADNHKFLSIYTENNTEKSAGGAIIMHGIGIHPNWDTIVLPLRSELPEAGWHTLSIQMPILKNEAEFEDYIPLFPEVAPRINAAVAFLKEKGVKNIVLIGHSLGATMGAHYMANKVDDAIVAFVAIGPSAGSKADVDYLNSLKMIRHPLLEIYGSGDLPAVINTEAEKARVAKVAGLKNYKQVKVDGADHFFLGKNNELITPIKQWMNEFANSK